MNTTSQRLLAATLATFGIVSAIPIPLAGLDFAGVLDVFGIDGGDSPRGVVGLVIAAAVLTIAVLGLACVGVVLAALGSAAARPILMVAALAGVVTALASWLPAGLLLGLAAYLCGPETSPVGVRRPAVS
ncbi:hypothetical protein ABZS29_36070 [Kribbella sp. NPDC005582]|uniref:hypothetical protein n=1 Tax=Kribbella sp. NPDC005582 TaxID=3156893 RepID=UPI0033BEA403